MLTYRARTRCSTPPPSPPPSPRPLGERCRERGSARCCSLERRGAAPARRRRARRGARPAAPRRLQAHRPRQARSSTCPRRRRGRARPINAAVDACNAVSLHSGLPISVVDLDRARPPLRIGSRPPARATSSTPPGQEIDLGGLLCLSTPTGPAPTRSRTRSAPRRTPRPRDALGHLGHARPPRPRRGRRRRGTAGCSMTWGATTDGVPVLAVRRRPRRWPGGLGVSPT